MKVSSNATYGLLYFLGVILFFVSGVSGIGSLAPLTPATVPDPGSTGPYAVTQSDYDFGDVAYQPIPNLPYVEVRARVFYPSNMSQFGQLPLIIMLHGMHFTCYTGTEGDYFWPCTSGYTRIDSYAGYDYVASNLASHGYIVVSISANGANAIDASFEGTDPNAGPEARALLIQEHLRRWGIWHSSGGPPFGNLFVGKVDLYRVGLMGHSRGGEAVVRALGELAGNSSYSIKGAFLLAPTDRFRQDVNGTPFGVLLPYCDGDVKQLQGAHYFDDDRYSTSLIPGPRHTLLAMATNHNYYNTVWTSGTPGTGDDWLMGLPYGDLDVHCGSKSRPDPPHQRGIGLAYINAFFRTYVRSDSESSPNQFVSYLTGDTPAPPSALGGTVYSSYHPQRGSAWQLDLNRLMTSSELTTNTLGGTATGEAYDKTHYILCGGDSPQPEHCLRSSIFNGYGWGQEPHTAPSLYNTRRGLSELDFAYYDTTLAHFRNDLPAAYRNVSGYQVLQFRVSVDFEFDPHDPIPPDGSRDFSVRLTDANGQSATVRVQQAYVSRPQPLYFPPGSGPGSNPAYSTPIPVPVPHVILNTVRMPLAGFTSQNPSLDLVNLQSVDFKFDQRTTGDGFLISDIIFANDPWLSVRCGEFKDVLPNSTFFPYIRCLACSGIVHGYSCGGPGEECDSNNSPYFRPSTNITRGQLAQYVSQAAGFSEDPGAQLFQDIAPGSTFYDYVQRLAHRDIVHGYPCGGPGEPCVPPANLPYYRPNDTATRGQLAQIVSEAAGYSDPPGAQRFQDVPPGSTFFDYVQRLAIHGIVGGYPCGGPGEPCVPPLNLPYFRPGNTSTRGQTAKAVSNTWLASCYTEPPPALVGSPPATASAVSSPTSSSTIQPTQPVSTLTPAATPPPPYPTIPLPVPSGIVPPPVPTEPGTPMPTQPVP